MHRENRLKSFRRFISHAYFRGCIYEIQQELFPFVYYSPPAGLCFYGPIATVYRQSRGISIFDVFLIESIFMVLMILFEIPWGWFADRFVYKKTLVSALSLPVASGCDSALLCSSICEMQSEKAFGRYYSLSTLEFLLATPASTFAIIPYGISVFAALITETSHSATVFLNQLRKIGKSVGAGSFHGVCSRFAVCFRTPHALFPAVKGKEIDSRYWGSA